MEFRDLINKARKIKEDYAVLNRTENIRPWQLEEYLEGFMGDVGDLNKLVLAKKGFQFKEDDVETKLGSELADCLLSIINIADELGVDLEVELSKTLGQLQNKISDRKVI